MTIRQGQYNRNSTRIDLPSDTTVIEESAFNGFKNLSWVTLPEGLREIGSLAFARCTSLEHIVIPDSVRIIGEGAFTECHSLKSILFLPKTLEKLDNAAFCMCTGITDVVIPGTVKTIGCGAFSGCKSLFKVIINDGVEVIEDDAFKGCSHLYRVDLPSSIKQVCYDAFDKCDDLYAIRVPNGEIDRFRYSTRVVPLRKKNLVIDEHVLKTKEYSLYFGDTVSLLDVSNTNEGTFYVPSNVKKIEKYAFLFCDKITDVVFPDGLEIIDDDAFEGFEHITHFSLPQSVRYLNGNAFKGKTLSFPHGNAKYEIIEQHLCEKLSDGSLKLLRANVNPGQNVLVIPESISCIGRSSCSNLQVKMIVLPSKLNKIESNAFWGCENLTNLTIPSSVRVLEDRCFDDLPNLSSIRMESVDPSNMIVGEKLKYTYRVNYDQDRLEEVSDYDGCILEVPRGSRTKYLLDKEFSNFEIIER